MTPRHISTAADLETPRAAIVEGFLEQIRMKTKEAVPFVAEAKRFMKALLEVQSEKDLQRLLANPFELPSPLSIKQISKRLGIADTSGHST